RPSLTAPPGTRAPPRGTDLPPPKSEHPPTRQRRNLTQHHDRANRRGVHPLTGQQTASALPAPQLAPSHIPAEPRPLPSSNAACRASGGARSPPAKPTAARTHSGNEASPPATSASPKLRLSPFLHSQRMALPAKPGRAGPPVSGPLCSAATSPTPKAN